jgi:hypothetical protein
MTRKISDTVYIEDTPPATCELCGVVSELRPYGPGGKWICFDCGMKDKETTNAAFKALIDGPGEKLQ